MSRNPGRLVLGINASRARSGGALAHLLGILSELEPTQYDIYEVHIWSYVKLLDALPNASWLIKHAPQQLDKSLLSQLWWERMKLPGLLRKHNCSILLNLDAGSLCRFSPSVTMSRDMLSYEPGEMERFGLSISRLRLVTLRYVQNASLRSADVAVFLTRYAGKMIQRSSGPIAKSAYIPHGVSDAFRAVGNRRRPHDNSRQLQVLYISNALPYKHQWHVVDAIGQLRAQGHDIKLTLVGGSEGEAQRRLEAQIAITDPKGLFITQHGFVQHATLPNYLAAADIFVFASSCENMPNTLVEAMAMGLPIACSNRGPMPEILEDGGVYFNPENPVEIATAVRTLIQDPEMSDRLAMRAQELSLKYSWARCSKETFSLLVRTAEQAKSVNQAL